MNNKIVGYEAEQEFISLLIKNKISFEYVNTWCDFKIKNIPIDVKSCMISHKFTNKKRKNQSYKIGRFHFTKKQREKEIYVALFTRFNEKFIFLGIIKTKENTPKYISLHRMREYKLLTINEMYNKIKEGT